MRQNTRKILWVLFALYGLVMLWLLLAPARTSGHPADWVEMGMHFNRHPFRTMHAYWNYLTNPRTPFQFRIGLYNLLGNTVMFVPLGFFPPLLLPKLRRFCRTMLLVLGIMTLIELLQMLLLVGTFDVGDLILNLSGAAIGYGCYLLIKEYPQA